MTTARSGCATCRKRGDQVAPGLVRRPARVLVLQHADWETPGRFGELLAAAGAEVHIVRLDLGETAPPWRRYDGVIAMGGPMSVNDPLPWVAAERDIIAALVEAGRPFLGVCLGAQLLAAACGARVTRGHQPEFGMHAVTTTVESHTDPLFGGLPRRLEVFQWHGEVFDLPAGAVPLARSPGIPNQAMRIGDMAYGLQFHVEVSTQLLERWLAVPSCRRELVQALGPAGVVGIAARLRESETRLSRLARRLFLDWLRLVDRCHCRRLVPA